MCWFAVLVLLCLLMRHALLFAVCSPLLGGLIAPSTTLAFPNFIPEMKRDGSMYSAYIRNMHSRSVAAQAFHSYYEHIREPPYESWDIATVGATQFNGSVIEGNVHWISKEKRHQRSKAGRSRVSQRGSCTTPLPGLGLKILTRRAEKLGISVIISAAVERS